MAKAKAAPPKVEVFKDTPAGAIAALVALESFGNARKPKDALLDANKGNEYLKQMFLWAYGGTNFFTYPEPKLVAKRIKKTKRFFTSGSGLQSFKAFSNLLDRLAMRKVTGHAARDEIREFFTSDLLAQTEILFYSRILNHDLRIGVQSTAMRNLWPEAYETGGGDGVPTFKGCMLSEKIEGAKKPVYPCKVEPKLDGIRITTIHDKDGSEGFTRGGNTYPESMKWILKALRKAAKGFMVDGEAMAKNWNDTSKLLKRSGQKIPAALLPKIEKELFFHVFDAVPLKDYYNPKTLQIKKSKFPYIDIPFRKRRKMIKKIVKAAGDFRIKIVKCKTIRNEKELVRFYKKCLALGFEGVMVKQPDGPYVIIPGSTRPLFWMKLKPEDEETVTIIGYKHGTGKNRNRLGAFYCKSLDGKRKYRCGGGFKDDERIDFWKRREEMIGKKIDVKKQEEEGNDIVARFPVFKRLRDDL